MSPNHRVVLVTRHKVKTGESLDSIAKANGLTWQQLAEFNWGTSVPEEINGFLRIQVGCTRKTADGKNYIFDSSDDPGIVNIPHPWKESGLPVDKTYTVRLRCLPPDDTETFSGTIIGPAGPLKNWPFVLKCNDREVEQSALGGTSPNRFIRGNWLSGKGGEFLFCKVPRGRYSIEVLLPGGKLTINEDYPPPPASESGNRAEPEEAFDRTAFNEDPQDLRGEE